MRISAKADHAVRASIEPVGEELLTSEPLQIVWIALRANIRDVLEPVTLADVVSGELPPDLVELTEQPDVWQPH